VDARRRVLFADCGKPLVDPVASADNAG
jgi:hypothetical protein